MKPQPHRGVHTPIYRSKHRTLKTGNVSLAINPLSCYATGCSLNVFVDFTCSSVNVCFVSCFSYLAFVAVCQLPHKNKIVCIVTLKIHASFSYDKTIWHRDLRLRFEARHFTYSLLALLVTLLQQVAVQFPLFSNQNI